ncbi:hypothetical protein HPB47_026268 [Ixodes persulcatus]|uniref:Uncharacterized protein n=1 Tax=Ixodes persulcatus TaxID=34615 RepID=A0AC60Q0F5_IXOPE|nr:hypothetical protein HPB47_026268 [Ixodes persulcatus]
MDKEIRRWRDEDMLVDRASHHDREVTEGRKACRWRPGSSDGRTFLQTRTVGSFGVTAEKSGAQNPAEALAVGRRARVSQSSPTASLGKAACDRLTRARRGAAGTSAEFCKQPTQRSQDKHFSYTPSPRPAADLRKDTHNEAAHTVARGLTRRASEPAQPGTRGNRMFTYREITNQYRLVRARYPPAQPELSKKQAVAWRPLQTNMYPNPVACSRFYPGQYANTCKMCKKKAVLPHILWTCSRAAPTIDGRKIQDGEHWEALLFSSDRQDQVWATRLAEEAAEVQGISAVF